MKKLLITITLLFGFLFSFSQTRDTTVVQDGNTFVIRINGDGTYTGLTINRYVVTDEDNRSAALCAAAKKQWCCSHPLECNLCGVVSAEISWYIECLFNWRSQKPKP